MIAALDVHYDDIRSTGTGTAVVFREWTDATAATEYVAVVPNIQPYVPGEFFRRELPCLLAVFERIREPLETVVVDGYVRLDQKPGLGEHLYEALSRRMSVIGVAKSRFRDAPAVEVLRGKSRLPLYVTAISADPHAAAENIKRMHGQHRLPTLLKRVDRIGRGV